MSEPDIVGQTANLMFQIEQRDQHIAELEAELDGYVECVMNCLKAAGYPTDVDEMEQKMKSEAGTKPSHHIKIAFKRLEAENAKLREAWADLLRDYNESEGEKEDYRGRRLIGRLAWHRRRVEQALTDLRSFGESIAIQPKLMQRETQRELLSRKQQDRTVRAPI